MTGSRIVALGHYQPAKVLTNDDLALLVDTDDEWIRSRVGIRARHIAESETLVDLATEAAQKALATSGFAPADIDLVVVATCTAVERSPNTACAVAARLGIPSPRPTTSTPSARASPTRWPPRTTRSGPVRRPGRW